MDTVDILKAFFGGDTETAKNEINASLQQRADDLVAQGREFVLGSLGHDISGM